MSSNKEVVFVLKEHNGEYQNWHRIWKRQLKEWLKDESITEGDMIVYPKRVEIIEIENKKKLIRKEVFK